MGTLTMRADGILHSVFDFADAPTREHAEEYIAARDELTGDQALPVIVEIVRVPFVERTIRMFFVNTMSPPPCRAVVTIDPALQMLYRSFQMVEEDPVPTEVFPTVEQAVAWIHGREGGD